MEIALVILGIASAVIISIFTYHIGKEVGRNKGKNTLKADINRMTVRTMLVHKRDNLKNL